MRKIPISSSSFKVNYRRLISHSQGLTGQTQEASEQQTVYKNQIVFLEVPTSIIDGLSRETA